jgi:hypothetical protein
MIEITQEAAFDFGLPKWPQMLVTGKDISVEQAKEIIFATDSFLTCTWEYGGGNDRKFNAEFLKSTGYARLNENPFDHIKYGVMSPEQREEHSAFNRLQYARRSKLEELAGFLQTEYVRNSWAASAFIYGPSGWCHPDGKIEFTHNVGKYPEVKTVAKEWHAIATRWPFLDIWVTLMNGESCEVNSPVVTFHVENGELKFYKGTVEPHEGVFRAGSGLGFIGIGSRNYDHEHGLPQEWIQEFADRVRPLIDRAMTETVPP